jgi:hypothetical protein
VSDIFREVEEDVRRERLEKLWKQYGDYAIVVAALIVLAVAGYKFWQHYEAVQIGKASAAYLQAMEDGGNGKTAEAAAAFAKIAKSAPGGYAKAARLSEANALLASGKTAEAIALYKKVADKDDGEIGATARIRAAWAEADSAPKAEIEALLAPIDREDSSWRYMAREILAYADFREGRLKDAEAAFRKLAAMADAPGIIRDRAGAMATLIRTGVGDYGTLPVQAPAEKPATENSSPDVQKGSTKK